MSSFPIHIMPTQYSSSSACYKTENSISPPSSPAFSSHSSPSLEPLTTSPSSSSYGCQGAETSFSFTHLLSSFYYPHPLQLDIPLSPLPLSNSPHSLKKRLALCQLEDFSPPPKRLWESMDVYNAISCNESVSPHFISNQFYSIFHSNEVIEGGGSAPLPCIGGAPTGDLDDVLDFLLHGANPASIMPPDVKDSGGELAGARMRIQGSAFAHETEHCNRGGNDLIDSKPVGATLPLIESNAKWQCASDVDASENGRARMHYETMLHKGHEKQVANGMGTVSEDWWRQRPSKIEMSCAQQRKQKPAVGVAAASASTEKSGSSSRCAGPTLMDIESALASTCSPSTISYPPLVSSPFGKSPYQLAAAAETSCLKEILHQETSSYLSASTSATCKEEPTTLEEGDRLCSWRRLQKRNHMEPRYTVKIRCEEDAVNDGYRWRKYGQKSIKNSPHPRSYYRCSSGACGVKKQVERSPEDAGLLLVSYEGIHLHHRPNALPTPSLLHTCAPTPHTCQGGPLSSLPTISSTDDNNNTSCTTHTLSASPSPLSHTSSTSTI